MKLTATKFRPGRDGAIKASVQVVDEGQEPAAVLFQDTITLTSAKSRATFAKEVESRDLRQGGLEAVSDQLERHAGGGPGTETPGAEAQG